MRHDWDSVLQRFIDAHDGNISLAAETLCFQTYVTKSRKEEAIENYKNILIGKKYAPPVFFRVMDNYVSIKNLKAKKELYAHKWSALRRLCENLGIDTTGINETPNTDFNPTQPAASQVKPMLHEQPTSEED